MTPADVPARLRPRKEPRQDRSRQTRDRFLDAAARIFATHGYSAGTTNRIAAEAGASIGSLYQYFPNKDSILVALVRRHVDDGTQLLLDAFARTDGQPVLDRLPVLVDAVLANHTSDPRLHQVLFEEAPRPPELLAELHELESVVVAAVESMLRDDPDLAVRDPAMAARLVVMSVESLVHRYVATSQDDLDVDAFRAELVTMLSGYLSGGGAAGPTYAG